MKPPPVPDGGRGTILLVDDDPIFAYVLRHALARAGFDVLYARSTAEALAALEGGALQPALVLSDMRLPGPQKGPELAAVVERRYPELPVLLMSGSPDVPPGWTLPLISKDRDIAELVERIGEIIAARRAA